MEKKRQYDNSFKSHATKDIAVGEKRAKLNQDEDGSTSTPGTYRNINQPTNTSKKNKILDSSRTDTSKTPHAELNQINDESDSEEEMSRSFKTPLFEDSLNIGKSKTPGPEFYQKVAEDSVEEKGISRPSKTPPSEVSLSSDASKSPSYGSECNQRRDTSVPEKSVKTDNIDLLKYINQELSWNLKCDRTSSCNKGRRLNKKEVKTGQVTQEGSKMKSISDILFSKQDRRSTNLTNDSLNASQSPSPSILIPSPSVKRKTVSGDEYQRVLQILVRQRALSEPGSKVGTEVAGVGRLDDIVYVEGGDHGHCRFFQAKHSSIKKININEEFLKTEFSKKFQNSADFHLLQFFKSFLKMKDHDNTASHHIEEIIFITERKVDSRFVEYKGLFKEIPGDDSCLNLRRADAIKYIVDLDWLKTNKIQFINYLESMNKSFIDEFFQKLRVVVCYLDQEYMHTLKRNGYVVEVDNLDDIVYSGSITPICRFFVNYTKGTKVEARELLRTVFPEKFKGDYNLYLLLYLESFLTIKKHPDFKNRQISEITFITNRGIESLSTEKSPMEVQDLEHDKCLNLQYPGTMKLKLSEIVKVKTINFLLDQPRFGETTREVLEEFLDKIRLVVGYPDLEWLTKRTFDEVFNTEVVGEESKHILNNYALHIEVSLLRDDQEFCTSEQWQQKVHEIKKLLRWSKIRGMSDLRTHKLYLASNAVVFQNTKIMIQDVSTFVNNSQDRVMVISVMNLELNAVKVLQVLEKVKLRKEQLLSKVLYLDLEDLLAAPFIVDSFNETNNILVLTCRKRKRRQNVTELAIKIGESLKTSKLKICLLTTDESDTFYKALTHITDLKNRVLNKQYKHGLKDLTDESQQNILSTDINFQGLNIPLRSLLNENIDYASEVIDESILWNLINNENTVVVGEDSRLRSTCYEQIPRYISRRYVSFSTVKNYSDTILFIIKAQDDGSLNQLKEKLENNQINVSDGLAVSKATGVVLVSVNRSEQLIERTVAQNRSHCVLLCREMNLYYLSELGLKLKLQDKMIFEAEKHYMKDIVERIQSNRYQGCEIDCRINILAADSGVGKSTFLAMMANEIKKTYPNVWILRIDLIDCRRKHKKSFEDLDKCENAFKFLRRIAISNDGKDQLGLNILDTGLQLRFKDAFKMVLLLDGYNEICEEYRKKVCILVNTLQRNFNIHSIWISTQVHKICELENMFNEPAFFLSDLTFDDQVKLMAAQWKSDVLSASVSIEQLTNDANSALIAWTSTIDDRYKSFTTIPLNVNMLAFVLMHNGRKVTNNINVSNLYERFVQIKFNTFNTETREKEQPFDEAKDILFAKMIRKVLMQVAVKYYFDLHTAKKHMGYKTLPGLEVIGEFKNMIKEDNFDRALTKIGLVTIDTEIDFTHESYGQFFFTEYILNNINHEVVQQFFVSHLFKSANLQLCRRLLNSKFGDEGSIKSYDLRKVKLQKRATKSLLKTHLESSANCIRREKLGNILDFLFHSLEQNDLKSYQDLVITLYEESAIFPNPVDESIIAKLRIMQCDGLATAVMQTFCSS